MVFQRPHNWTSDLGYAPISFTNLSFSHLGNGDSLVVDTNIPAWLQYNVYENDGTTNLTVDSGSVTFWLRQVTGRARMPVERGRANGGGCLKSAATRPIPVTAGGAFMWMIPATNIYFSAQTNDLSSTLTTYLSVSDFMDDQLFPFCRADVFADHTAFIWTVQLATNGPGVTVYPGPEVLTNGFT
jgi:hypothetical protein